MRAVDVIERKRDGFELSREEIEFFIAGMLDGRIEQYQVTAWLMAVYFRGMTPRETASLASAMMRSGEAYNWEGLRPGRVVDKHSSGGVGDKVSIVLAPLVAAMGMTDPMISGRGLGHTGGTLDKLESIPGFNIHPTAAQFRAQLAELGTVMAGQSESFVPADRRLYSLRDVTGTVPSVPLICGSILSKKAAAGVQSLLMDVKVGSGAFMQTLPEARTLAVALKETGDSLGMTMRVMITDMNQPLGRMIGNSLEILECIEALQGGGPEDLRTLVVEQAAEMLCMAQLPGREKIALETARAEAADMLDHGGAWDMFLRQVKAQGGSVEAVCKPNGLPDVAKDVHLVCAESAGCLVSTDCKGIGIAAALLGAGRLRASDSIDFGVGLEMLVRVGDRVDCGQPLVRVFHRDGRGLDECVALLKKSLHVSAEPVLALPLIYEKI